MNNSLPKSETLHKRDDISSLMKEGKSFAKHPIRIVYLSQEAEQFEVKVFFSAPKRNFKKAVDRNRIKRLLREAYRLNNALLKKSVRESGRTVHIAFLFTGRELPEFNHVQDKIILLLQRLEKELQANS